MDEAEYVKSEEEKKLESKIRLFTWFGWGFVFIGAMATVPGFIALFSEEGLGLNEFGDYLGGTVASCWALAGLFFIYVAFLGQKVEMIYQREELKLTRNELEATREELKGQREQMELQNENLRTQNFENTFFQLLKLLNEISTSMIVNISDVEDLNNQEKYNYQVNQEPLKGSLKGKSSFIYYQRRFYLKYVKILNDLSLSSGKDYAYSEEGQLEVLHHSKKRFMWDFESDLTHYFNSFVQTVIFTTVEGSNRDTYFSILKAQLSLSESKLLFYYLLDLPEIKRQMKNYGFFEKIREDDLLLEEHKEFYQ